MCAPVLIEKHRRVTLLRLASDNPCNPLTDAVGRIDSDDPVHATFITGSDRKFAAGADIAAMSALTYADASQSDYVGRNCDRLRARCKPPVAGALDMANSMARHSSPVLIAIQEAEGRSVESSLDDGLLFERRLFHAGFALHDQKEGMAAFLQKRAPEFLNK